MSDQGDDDGALTIYLRALDLDPKRASTLYNVGLIHKYRQAWRESFDYNSQAFDLRPDDEAIRWNLAIAATGLGDWPTARRVWRLCGYDVGDGEGPIAIEFGAACVRLNPDDNAEVVWVDRCDPVRGSINNVPYADSGFFFRDVVLHDGAATGWKVYDEREYPIFNVFQRMERSRYGTATVEVACPSEADAEELRREAGRHDMFAEDWTSSTQVYCKACSEGVTHVHHDTDLSVWESRRTFGVAFVAEDELDSVLDAWATKAARQLLSVSVTR